MQASLGSLPKHGSLEFGKGAYHLLIFRPIAVVESIASVRLQNPAPAFPSRSIIMSMSCGFSSARFQNPRKTCWTMTVPHL
jgi:hypothetical protein